MKEGCRGGGRGGRRRFTETIRTKATAVSRGAHGFDPTSASWDVVAAVWARRIEIVGRCEVAESCVGLSFKHFPSHQLG